MAPVTIQDIVQVSSESETHPASNLLRDKKWMTCLSEKSSKVEIEFGFQTPVQIHYIDVGYFNISSMEVFVGSSSWPPSKDYVQLIPAVMMQSAIDARMGKNRTGCKMINFSEHMIKEAGVKKWNRVRLILLQPHARNKQLGLEFIRFGTPKNSPQTLTPKSKGENSSKSYSSPASEKAESSFFRMMNRVKNSDEKLPMTTGKIRQLSEPGPSLSRNIKMLMASKSSTPQPMRKSNEFHKENVSNKFVETKSNKPRKLFNKSSDRENSDKNKIDADNLTERLTRNEKIFANKNPPSSHPTSQTFDPQDVSQAKKFEKPINKQSSDTNMTKLNKDKLSKVQMHRPAPKTQQQNLAVDDHASDGKSHSTSDDCVLDESRSCTEPKYTEIQVKKLKQAVTKFFLSLNKDELNLAKLKVKDLRKKFESVNDVKLNREGRKYFRDVTAKNIHLIQEQQQNKIGSGKRKSSEVLQCEKTSIMNSSSGYGESPKKLFRSELSTSVHKVQCPLCLRMFDGSVVEAHASVCLEEDGEMGETQTFLPQFENNSIHTILPRDSVVDCSENSCLTSVEQQNWINFSKEPKPYQERLNTSEFAGCQLVKCPSCGQKYKIEDIQQHSDECAEKVNSKYTKMGLYYVKNSETASQNRAKSSKTFSTTTTGTDNVVVID